MARVPNRFTDPVSGFTYDWVINHDEEEEFGKTRNIERGAPTSGVGLIRQQGDESPLVIRIAGKILEATQLQQMLAWYSLTRIRSIYFRDFAQDEYEVIITSFQPKRVRTVKNPRGGTGNGRLHYWTYSLEMEVLTIRAGVWAGLGIVP